MYSPRFSRSTKCSVRILKSNSDEFRNEITRRFGYRIGVLMYICLYVASLSDFLETAKENILDFKGFNGYI
jgi:hypothetical protein